MRSCEVRTFCLLFSFYSLRTEQHLSILLNKHERITPTMTFTNPGRNYRLFFCLFLVDWIMFRFYLAFLLVPHFTVLTQTSKALRWVFLCLFYSCVDIWLISSIAFWFSFMQTPETQVDSYSLLRSLDMASTIIQLRSTYSWCPLLFRVLFQSLIKHKAEVDGRLSVSVRHSVRQPFEGLALLYLTTVANLSCKLSW